MINDFKYVLGCQKWRNILYDFNDNNSSENCSLNVFAGSQVSQLINLIFLI